MKLKLLVIMLALGHGWVMGQYTLSEAISDTRQHSTLSSLSAFVNDEVRYSVNSTSHRLLPQISLGGQASYQSATSGIDLSFPGFNIEKLSKDQYKIQADVNQLIYDGGTTGLIKEAKKNSGALETNNYALEIDNLVEQAIVTFFGLQELKIRKQQLQIKEDNINASYKKLEAAVSNGFVLKSELNLLAAEKLKLGQQANELESQKAAFEDLLTLLTGKNAEVFQNLVLPDRTIVQDEINVKAPSLEQFKFQSEALNLSKKMDDTAVLPKLGAFAQLGYGKPGLNFLKNQFDTYYIGGVKLQWNLSAFYNSKNNRQLNNIALEKLNARKTATETRIKMKNTKLMQDMQRLETNAKIDEDIITLRKKIHETASIQLENGSITATEFLLKLNDVSDAQLNLELNKLNLIKTTSLINFNAGWLRP